MLVEKSSHLQEDSRAKVFVSIPPVAGTAGAAAGTQDALIQAILLHSERLTVNM